MQSSLAIAMHTVFVLMLSVSNQCTKQPRWSCLLAPPSVPLLFILVSTIAGCVAQTVLSNCRRVC